MLVKITRYGDEWLNPAQIIERNNLTGYTASWVADNHNNTRENLWNITGENIIDVFSMLDPVEFSGDWDEYVIHYNNQIALSKTVFTKLQIRRAMRSLGNETILDGLLTNEAFKKDWSDAIEIDLSDPLTAQALASVQVDINAVKLAIAGIVPDENEPV